MGRFRNLEKSLDESKKIIGRQAEQILLLENKLKSYEQYISENQAMRSEHVVAEQIQRSMLPDEYPAFTKFPQVDLYADMDTAREVGGDFYDYFSIDDDHICFGISDVEGKGIPAAMYMAIAKSMVKLRVQSGEKLEDVFTDINKLFYVSSMQKRFITSWMAVLEISSRKMNYINAGHNPPILLKKDGSIEFVKSKSGLPLASYYSKKHTNAYKSFEMMLDKDDVLLLYTDGVTEAQNKDDEFFGEERLKDAVSLYMTDKHTMKELTAYIRRQVNLFANHVNQDDDITLLALTMK